MEQDGIREYLGNFDDYLEKRNRPVAPVQLGVPEQTKTEQIKEKKKDRKFNAMMRELKAQVKKAEEAIEQNEQRIVDLEAKLADPATYADQVLMRQLTEEYAAEQEKTAALYDVLEAAEMAVLEMEE